MNISQADAGEKSLLQNCGSLPSGVIGHGLYFRPYMSIGTDVKFGQANNNGDLHSSAPLLSNYMRGKTETLCLLF